ncbi:MAG: hypothetical protein K1000chlam4_01099 [Chlamydiae bacterium]|nr:hypothetical protein [Chlamydiota bacterium]
MIPAAVHYEISKSTITQGFGSEVNYFAYEDQEYILRHVPKSIFKQELRILKEIASCGIGPELINHHSDRSLFLLRFIPGEVLPAFTHRTLSDYIATMKQLRRLHQIIPGDDEKSHWPFHLIYDEYEKLQKNELPYPSSLDKAILIVKEIEKRLGSFPKTLCHNDFHRKNVVVSPDGPRIIDWSTAAVGDPYFDLAKFCISLPRAFKIELLHHYLGHRATKVERAHLYLMEQTLLMVMALHRYSKSEGTCEERLPLPGDFFRYPRSSKEFLNTSLQALHAFLIQSDSKRFHSALNLCH